MDCENNSSLRTFLSSTDMLRSMSALLSLINIVEYSVAKDSWSYWPESTGDMGAKYTGIFAFKIGGMITADPVDAFE